MEDWREPMADVVNRFYHACASDLRCQADSHLALSERLPAAWSEAESLADRYQRVLAWQGLQLGARSLPCPAASAVAGPPSPLL